MKIAYSEYATKQIDEIFSNYSIYDQYGKFTQQFINWNSEFHRHLNSNVISKQHLSKHGWHKIGTIGVIEYYYITVTDTEVFEIVEFRFAKLPYAYKITDDAGYGYKIIKSTLNGLFSILTPQKTQLTNFKFDNIIGFHHSTEDYNVIHAIGFIGDRVYEIMRDGTIQVLHMSRTDYLDQKHRYDECKKRFMHYLIENKQNKTYKTMNRIRLTESQLHNVIRRCINEAYADDYDMKANAWNNIAGGVISYVDMRNLLMDLSDAGFRSASSLLYEIEDRIEN